MLLVLLLLMAVFLFLFATKKKERWIKQGTFSRSKNIMVNEHQYYVEEVRFESYSKALSSYFKIVAEIAGREEIIEARYDLYDWTFNYFRFKETTVSLKHYRPFHVVQLARSDTPLSLDTIEKDNPHLKL